MKYFKWIILFLEIMFIFSIPFTAAALDTGLDTESVSEEEKAELIDIEDNEFKKFTSYSPLVVKCFDVREDHMLVIGASKGSTAVIAVYDADGNFQYGFKKKVYGSFRVMWSGNDIVYYGVRSSLLFKINEDGEITDIRRAANTKENSVYDIDVLTSTTREVGDVTYRMTNGGKFIDSFSGSFKNITKTDAQGTYIVYDATDDQIARRIKFAVIAVLFCAFLAYGIVSNIKRFRANSKV